MIHAIAAGVVRVPGPERSIALCVDDDHGHDREERQLIRIHHLLEAVR